MSTDILGALYRSEKRKATFATSKQMENAQPPVYPQLVDTPQLPSDPSMDTPQLPSDPSMDTPQLPLTNMRPVEDIQLDSLSPAVLRVYRPADNHQLRKSQITDILRKHISSPLRRFDTHSENVDARKDGR